MQSPLSHRLFSCMCSTPSTTGTGVIGRKAGSDAPSETAATSGVNVAETAGRNGLIGEEDARAPFLSSQAASISPLKECGSGLNPPSHYALNGAFIKTSLLTCAEAAHSHFVDPDIIPTFQILEHPTIRGQFTCSLPYANPVRGQLLDKPW